LIFFGPEGNGDIIFAEPGGTPNAMGWALYILSMIGLFYHWHTWLVLLSILPSSPHRWRSNRFKIKGKRAMLSPNAEKSMLRRMASLDVQNLWEKCFQATYLFNSLKQLNLRTAWFKKKY
jgi:hypothetical protein